MDLAKAGEDEVLEQFTSYASCANHEHFGILDLLRQSITEALGDVEISLCHRDQVIEMLGVDIDGGSEM